MAILFCDSMNSYGSTSDMTKMWGTNTDNTKNTVNLTGGPSSDPCIQLATSNTTLLEAALYSVPNTSTVIGGRFKFKQAALGSATYVIITISGQTSGGSTAAWRLSTNSSGQLVSGFLGNGGGGTLATGSVNIADNAWHLIEFQVDGRDAPNGTVKVWLDGVLDINFGPGDVVFGTQHANPWSVVSPYVRLEAVNTGTGAIRSFKDIIIFDAAGIAGELRTADQPFGNITIATLRPNGAGTSTQFTANTGLNYAAVDEVSQDDGTTYVEATTSGYRDLYAMSDMGVVPSAVLGVVAKVFASNPGSGTISMKQTLKSGGTTDVGASAVCNIIGGYKSKVYDLNPNGSIAWTLVAVDALEQGFEVA